MARSILLLTLLLLAFVCVASAQASAIEVNFEKNKARYTREHFVNGEDASSGYDYLFYKSRDKIVKIRSIWSGSYTNELRIEDFYFDDGLVLVRRSTGQKRNLGVLKRGRHVVLKPKEELHFKNGKLTRWIENGSIVGETDTRWAEIERTTLEGAKSELESYSWLKEGN